MTPTLSRIIVRTARGVTYQQLAPEVVAKVKIALLDMLSCVYESLDLPWSVQAMKIAAGAQGSGTVIGTWLRTSIGDAAFVNAILGHGLVREDMHTRSVSHLGVVIFPTLLALAQSKRASGKDFITGAVCGYETGAAIGRAVMDQEIVRLYRPTGITGPLGASVAGAILLGLSEDASTSALGLAANTTVGLNEWPYAGGDEMFLHTGFAARNAVTAVQLAELGSFASETAIDGQAGLFASLRRRERADHVKMFDAELPQIMYVFHKPAPACNYAQTAAQAALKLATEEQFSTDDIVRITVKSTAAAIGYPGCNSAGPFERTLQAKMSIHYCVAATLARGVIEEANYRKLDDAEISRLAGITHLEEDAALTSAYPGQQGSEVVLMLRDGRRLSRRLEDVIPATPEQIRARFRSACSKVLGSSAAGSIEETVDRLEKLEDAAELSGKLALVERPVGV